VRNRKEGVRNRGEGKEGKKNNVSFNTNVHLGKEEGWDILRFAKTTYRKRKG
jgi:hypothetical protein